MLTDGRTHNIRTYRSASQTIIIRFYLIFRNKEMDAIYIHGMDNIIAVTEETVEVGTVCTKNLW